MYFLDTSMRFWSDVFHVQATRSHQNNLWYQNQYHSLNRPINSVLGIGNSECLPLNRVQLSKFLFLCAPLDGYTDANSCFCLFVSAILLFSSLYFRFELREDRKREMVRTTGHMDSLRRDLNQTIARLSPVPPTIGLTPLISPSPYLGNPAFPQVSLSPTHTGSQFTRTHLDLRVGGGHQSNHASNSNFLIPPVLDGRSNFSLATPSSYDDEISWRPAAPLLPWFWLPEGGYSGRCEVWDQGSFTPNLVWGRHAVCPGYGSGLCYRQRSLPASYQCRFVPHPSVHTALADCSPSSTHGHLHVRTKP